MSRYGRKRLLQVECMVHPALLIRPQRTRVRKDQFARTRGNPNRAFLRGMFFRVRENRAIFLPGCR